MPPVEDSLADLKKLIKKPPLQVREGMCLKEKYQIGEVLAKGGMGCVYQARDIEHERDIAIKEILTSAEDKGIQLQERLVREYYFLAAINHPNLVAVYECLQEEGQLFLAMELVGGISLKDLIREKPESLSLLEQLAIANQIARAVEILHTAEILHRDIKPANIMVDMEKKNSKLLDLGLGKSLKGELSTITHRRAIVGTPGYLSPEQIDGRLSKKSDIFSLGVTLYQFFLWKKRSPFITGNKLATFMSTTTKELPPILEQISWKLPLWEKRAYRALDKILGKMLKKTPNKRLINAKESADALEKIYRDLARDTRIRVYANSCPNSQMWAPTTDLDVEQRKNLQKLGAEYTQRIDQSQLSLPKQRKWIKFIIAMLIFTLLGVGLWFAVNRWKF